MTMQSPMQPPMEPQPPVPPQAPRRRSIVGPVILILLGLLFLLKNVGLFDWNIWAALWRLWPVFLIAAGLDILLGRRTNWGSWVVVAVIVLAVGGAVFMANTSIYFTEGHGTAVKEELRVPLDSNAKTYDVSIQPGIAELKLVDIGGGNLVEGSVNRLSGENLVQSKDNNNGDFRYVLKSEAINIVPGFYDDRDQGHWDVFLNNTVPMRLNVSTGIGKSEVNLTHLNITDLRVSTGIGEATVFMPAKGKFYGKINSGIGKVTIEIPKGIAYKIKANAGLGAVRFNGDSGRSGNYYISDDYDKNANRMELDINGGIGEVVIRAR